MRVKSPLSLNGTQSDTTISNRTVSNWSPLSSDADVRKLVSLRVGGEVDLEECVVEALRESGGAATVLDVAKYIWDRHEAELRDAGDIFYKWQYDMRWAADRLRRRGVIKSAQSSPRGLWELSP